MSTLFQDDDFDTSDDAQPAQAEEFDKNDPIDPAFAEATLKAFFQPIACGFYHSESRHQEIIDALDSSHIKKLFWFAVEFQTGASYQNFKSAALKCAAAARAAGKVRPDGLGAGGRPRAKNNDKQGDLFDEVEL